MAALAAAGNPGRMRNVHSPWGGMTARASSGVVPGAGVQVMLPLTLLLNSAYSSMPPSRWSGRLSRLNRTVCTSMGSVPVFLKVTGRYLGFEPMEMNP